jgi:hypothetical protein
MLAGCRKESGVADKHKDGQNNQDWPPACHVDSIKKMVGWLVYSFEGRIRQKVTAPRFITPNRPLSVSGHAVSLSILEQKKQI